MCCFRLPQWVINRIDQIRRSFLWAKSTDDAKGISLINWQAACLPKNWGGLGIMNLKLFNMALLLRWWWKAYHDKDCLWTVTVRLLRRRGGNAHQTAVWLVGGSFFWKQLQSLKHLFERSIEWKIGSGNSISFWFDSWNGSVILEGSGHRLRNATISLRQAWPIIGTLQPDLLLSDHINFTQQEDYISWRLDHHGHYSSKSMYMVLTTMGKTRWHFSFTWKCPVPLTVKIFSFMALKNKILTKVVLSRRGMNVDQRCVLCTACMRETTLHLLFLCPYAVAVWAEVAAMLQCPILSIGDSIKQTWYRSWARVSQGGAMKIKVWAASLMCTMWHIWKQRNAVVFGGQAMRPQAEAIRCVQQFRLWLQHC